MEHQLNAIIKDIEKVQHNLNDRDFLEMIAQYPDDVSEDQEEEEEEESDSEEEDEGEEE